LGETPSTKWSAGPGSFSPRRFAVACSRALAGLNVGSDKSRQAFIDFDTTTKNLDAAPDAEWRAIIALARYGGLRIPTELAGLRWSDVDWTGDGARFPGGSITVTSPKTEHVGKGGRIVPLFPSLRRWLREAWDVALETEGALPEFVISRARATPRTNLRQGLLRIIARAGLKPWPQLFVNLRASRATELANQYPGHVAAEWLGHTEAVADEHYRMATVEHYARATQEPDGALQGALQTAADEPCQEPPNQGAQNEKSPVVLGSLLVAVGGEIAQLPDKDSNLGLSG